MSYLKIVLSVLFIVTATTFINAQPVDKKGGPGSQENMNKPPALRKGMGKGIEGHKKFMREKLHLTDQQVSKIESLRSEHMKKMVDLKADLKKNMIDQKSIRDKDNFTRGEIIAGVEKSNKIKNEMAISKANHKMDVWELLTPEQKKLVKENPQWLMGERHPMMRKGSDGKRPPMMHKNAPDK